ncbi:Rho GTPase-activating protein 40 [Oopsacas minuta]|uniref:Rho GTPase-activating protein 40 n=1 Tax=Oopsacas minuta TaxID=111878 RepID=A0AAV7JV61_9METZ|nr:Rho GTPase-activating protein 40 [Oopsacas minuta]
MEFKKNKDKGPILQRGRLISTDLETFFSEWQDIQSSNRDSYHPQEEKEVEKLTEEEKEEKEVQEQIAWLEDAGMENIVERMKQDTNINGFDLEASVAWMSVKQASVVRRRVFSVQNTIRRRKAKKFIDGPRAKEEGKQISTYTNDSQDSPEDYPACNDLYDNIFPATTDIQDSCEVPGAVNEVFELQASNPLYDSVTNKTNISGVNKPPKLKAIAQPVSRLNPLRSPLKSFPTQQECEFDIIGDIVSMPLSPSTPNNKRNIFGMTRSTSENQLARSSSYNSSESVDSCFTLNKLFDKDGLPDVNIIEEDDGITRIGDLHITDLKKIGSLALIELTAILDNYNLVLKKSKTPKMKPKEIGVFGVSIDQMLVHDLKRRPHYKGNVPLFLEEICECIEDRGLSEEGILRIPGNVARVKKIVEGIECSFNNGRFSWNGISTKDLSSILKQFLRDMPSPLVTHEFLETFLVINNVPDPLEKLKALNYLILTLPLTHSACLKRILQFTNKVINHCELNKMNMTNCSLVIAPNLFYTPARPVAGKNGLANEEVQRATAITDIMKMIIKYHDALWVIPNQLITILRMQMDQQNNNLTPFKKNPKRWNFFRTGTNSLKKQKNPMIQDNMINDTLILRIQGPLFVQKSKAFKVDQLLTAGQALREYSKQFTTHKETINKWYPMTRQVCYGCFGQKHYPDTVDLLERLSLEDLHIYEFSGNLKIRRLNNKALLHAVRMSNPNAVFIVLPDSFPDPNRLLQER